MKLPRLFSRKKPETVPALAPPPPKAEVNAQEAQAQLRDQFKQAMYGRYFRTRTFEGVMEGESVWREAVYIPDYGWQVQTLQREVGPDDEFCTRCSILNVNVGFDFMQAVESLSKFEMSATTHRGAPLIEDEVEQLGGSHVRAFAEREGLVFDVYGVPHPTLDGRIVSEGVFSDESRSRVQAFAKEAQDRLAALPVFALPRINPESTDLFEVYHSIYMDKALAIIKKYADFISNEGWIPHPEDERLENKWSFDIHMTERDIANKTSEWYDNPGKYTVSGHLRGSYEQRDAYNNFLVKSFAGANADITPFRAGFLQAYDMVALYGYVSVANHLRAHQGHPNSYFKPSLLEAYLKDIKKIMNRLGLDKYTPETLILRLQREGNRYDAELAQIMDWVEQTSALFRNKDNIASLRTNQIKLAAPSVHQIMRP